LRRSDCEGERVKVLFVTNGFPPRGRWGTEFYTWQLVGGLVDRGVDVAILHPVRDGSKPRYELEQVTEPVPSAPGTRSEVPVYLLHNAGDPRKEFRSSYSDPEVERIFEQVLEKEQPDIVHFTYLLWGLSVNLPQVAKRHGVPSVVTLTDYGLLCHRGQMYNSQLTACKGPHPADVCAKCIREPSRYDGDPLEVAMRRILVHTLAKFGGLGQIVTTKDVALREAEVRTALESVDRFLAPTEVFEKVFLEWGLPREKLAKLVYSFDDRPYAIARPAPVRPRPSSPIRFGFMGQFTPHKGLGTLLEACRIMQQRLPESVEPWRLHLFGRGTGGRHRCYAEEVLGGELGPRIVVEEPFEPEQAPEVLAKLDAVVVPSEWDENAPLTILQARAAGVPVLGSDMLGVAEVIEPPKYGVCFPVGDAAALADCMRDVVLGRIGRSPDSTMPMTLEDHTGIVRRIYRDLLA
jgi:glycosyltransferase involved in cell wall biosynthesis